MLNKSVLIAAVLMTAMLSGCEKEGPSERAGETVDDAARQLRETGRDVGNKVEDACEDMKEGVGAADTDC